MGFSEEKQAGPELRRFEWRKASLGRRKEGWPNNPKIGRTPVADSTRAWSFPRQSDTRYKKGRRPVRTGKKARPAREPNKSPKQRTRDSWLTQSATRPSPPSRR